MSDQSLRDTLLLAIHLEQEALTEGEWIDMLLAKQVERLSANGLAIVPVEATEAIHQAVVDAPVESTFNELWQAMLAAAPPAAVLLKGTQDE